MLKQDHTGAYQFNGIEIMPNTWMQDNGQVYRVEGEQRLHVSKAYYDRLRTDFESAIKEEVKIMVLPPTAGGVEIVTAPKIDWLLAPTEAIQPMSIFYKFHAR